MLSVSTSNWLDAINWLDAMGVAGALTCLEAAITGRGRTVGKGRVVYWNVAPWMRPILGGIGLVVLLLACFDFLNRR